MPENIYKIRGLLGEPGPAMVDFIQQTANQILNDDEFDGSTSKLQIGSDAVIVKTNEKFGKLPPVFVERVNEAIQSQGYRLEE